MQYKKEQVEEILKGLEYCMDWKNQRPDAVRFAQAMTDARQHIIDSAFLIQELESALESALEHDLSSKALHRIHTAINRIG